MLIDDFELCLGELDSAKLYEKYLNKLNDLKCGAWLNFSGLIRAENGIEALYFEMDETLLLKWFKQWQEKALKEDIKLVFAHSKGRVDVGLCSYFVGILSKHRKNGLNMLNDFVENFKICAPIWKYELVNGKKIYVKNRSVKLMGAGLLGNKNDKL